MIVVDAGVLAVALVDRGPSGAAARARLAGQDLAAPALVDLEVAAAFRGLVRAGKLAEVEARRGLRRLQAMPVERAAHAALVSRCWDLRDDLTVYDASYVALAEMLGVSLITGDGRLAGAPDVRCAVELLSAPG